jgi:hypothetical protein
MTTRPGRHDGPKAYQLAEQLGIKPRELLAAARELEIPLQNRLTRLDHAAVERLRAHFLGRDRGTTPTEGS